MDQTFSQVQAFIRQPSCADQWLGDTRGHVESESNWRDNFSLAPKRRRGRPLTRWDDKLRSFCKLKFPDTQCWMYVAASSAWKRKADDFVNEFVKLYSDESA